MAEVRLTVKGEDKLSSELTNVSASLDKVDKGLQETKKSAKELDNTLKAKTDTLRYTSRAIDSLLSGALSVTGAFEDMGFVSEENKELFDKLEGGIEGLTEVMGLLSTAQNIYRDVSRATSAATKLMQVDMTGLTVSTGAAATAMALLAAKILLVIGAGVALGVIIATVVLGLVRMVKQGESAGEAFRKSFDFAIGSIKKFTSAIGDSLSALGGFEEAEDELALTVEEVTDALDHQREVIKPKKMEMEDFIAICKEAGATEEQLAQAANEARISFEKQETAEEKLNRRIKEVKSSLDDQRDAVKEKTESNEEFAAICEKAGASEEQLNEALEKGKISFKEEAAEVDSTIKALDDFVNAINKAANSEIWFGSSTEDAALKIMNQQKVVRGKLEPMDQYRQKLMDIFKNEEMVNKIIEEGIWPWEEQKNMMKESTAAAQEAIGILGNLNTTVKKSQSTEPEKPEWLKNVLEYLQKSTETKMTELDLYTQENELLGENVELLEKKKQQLKEILDLLLRGQEAYKSFLGKSQQQATEMQWALGG